MEILIPLIRLEWSDWIRWNELSKDARRGGIKVPNRVSGVYEAKYEHVEERLTIGKASNLRHRVKQGLIKGIAPHSAGINIRGNEDTSRICVRWAITDRPAAVEEELHRRHKDKFHKFPKYVHHT